ncbi:MAG: ATP-grasp domain-containing protein [Alphaproteobacteria bacterium]|nr:ATP-grasp domain-containing protein [Alphaproteobacteria bacterium]
MNRPATSLPRLPMVGGSQRPWTDWTVAVTGMNARADNPGPGLAIARCLRRDPAFRGSIIGLGYDVLDPGLHTRDVVDAGVLLPYPSDGTEALKERLDEVLATHRIDALIPALDAEMATMIALEPWLQRRGVRLFTPTQPMLEARAKDRLPDLAAAAGIATPACRRITNAAALDEITEFPIVVKGCFYDAYVCRTAAEAHYAFAKLAATWGYPVLVQPFVPGVEVNMTGIGDGMGGILGQVAMRKRALTDKGKAWAGVTIRDAAFDRFAADVMASLRWRGPFEIEALRDPDGRLHLIEINPRFPAWIYLSAEVGRNLPSALLRLMAGEAPQTFDPPSAGACFVRFAEEVVLSLAELEAVTITGATLPSAPPIRRVAA